MKKAVTSHAILGLLAAVLLLNLSACKKDSTSANIGLIGKWSQNFPGSRDVIEQYEFKSNDSVEFYRYQIDTVTKSIIGYNYRTIGKYKVEKSVLTMYSRASFWTPSGSFGPVSQLVPVGSSTDLTYTIKLSDQKNQLYIYFSCPPNADCMVSPETYFKKE